MITKMADIIDIIAGSAIGASRAKALTDSEAGKLKKQYGLDQDASLEARNAARGAAGSMLGSTAGGLTGAAGVFGLDKYAPKVLSKMGPKGTAAAFFLPSILGGLGGAALTTNKYSKSALPTKTAGITKTAYLVKKANFLGLSMDQEMDSISGLDDRNATNQYRHSLQRKAEEPRSKAGTMAAGGATLGGITGLAASLPTSGWKARLLGTGIGAGVGAGLGLLGKEVDDQEIDTARAKKDAPDFTLTRDVARYRRDVQGRDQFRQAVLNARMNAAYRDR